MKEFTTNRKAYLKARENARRRCTQPTNNRFKYYGAKGIQCLLSREDVMFIADRDNADDMKKPQLHRLDNKKHYTIENTVFIEASNHSRITHLGAKRSKESRKRMSEAGGTQYGENHPMSILKYPQVKYILGSKNRGVSLARRFGVSKSTISAIRHRRIWSWVK